MNLIAARERVRRAGEKKQKGENDVLHFNSNKNNLNILSHYFMDLVVSYEILCYHSNSFFTLDKIPFFVCFIVLFI